MPSGFPGLTRVDQKPLRTTKAKAPPLTPPASSPPRPPIASRSQHRNNDAKGALRKPATHNAKSAKPASKPAATILAQKRPATTVSKPATRFASIEASSSDEDDNTAAPVKAKKRPRPESIKEPASGDEDPAPASISKKPRTLPPVTHDAEVIRHFEVVMECATQNDRIAHRVEYLHEAARLLPRMDAYIHLRIPFRVWNDYWQVQSYFEGIMKVFPGLADNTAYLRQRPELVGKLALWMKKVAGKARSDDLNRIKDVILECADVEDPKGLKEKSVRGFKHPETARLLCPVTKLKKFDRDPDQFCRKIRNMDKGRHRVKGRKWPLVMYNMKLHVPGKPLSGFLKSDTVLHAFQACFTGPSSTGGRSGGKSRGKPPISRKLTWSGINIVTIVYVAVLVRFALSDQKEYHYKDGDFHANDFISSVLTSALRDPEWREDLTAWYERRVYGNQACSDDEDTDSDDEPSSYDLMMQGTAAAIAAKERRITQSPNATPEPYQDPAIEDPLVNRDAIDELATGEQALEDTAGDDFFEQANIEEQDVDVKPGLVGDYSSGEEDENA
ncbi:uncharacterized protein TRAVEDRAFT_42351 [Trametes versicolor FP-101664 SS1]|uniref:uncharacterized protein n=1 Tax=Trametes versicolor (strain FP-101664) TaxID=717944 RepID=UPI00046243D5|nr:uncharacterized protein TRAVEDRAFT_42351 [Trametes versicolor FP-101664 SS1]EIW64944.1 hypothetical protein TRAVEDRAFT_42351 [Trametes versicolor FP-101664 SS1]